MTSTDPKNRTVVVNIRDKFSGPTRYVYIGRQRKSGVIEDGYFGNPFPINGKTTRKQAIEKFRKYFLRRVEEDPKFKSKVRALKGKVLGCYCKPRPCHGDVIAGYIEKNLKERATRGIKCA